jgi:hypothetical protein
VEAIANLADRTGSSVAAIEKYILAKNAEAKHHFIKSSIKHALASGEILVHHHHKNSYKLPVLILLCLCFLYEALFLIMQCNKRYCCNK